MFAERLRTALRESDTAARLAGDEFVIILETPADADDAVRVADKILALVRQPFELGTMRLAVSTSIGVAYSALPEARADGAGPMTRTARVARRSPAAKACWQPPTRP